MSLQLMDEEDRERPSDTPEVTARADWGVAVKRAASKFSADQCTDKAAALTYFSMQSLFPGLIAVLSLINVLGGKNTPERLINIIANIAGKSPDDETIVNIKHFVENIHTQGGGGIALVVGVLLSIWSASGYVGGFSRALNKIYEVPEGRPVWTLRPALYLVTIIEIVLILVVVFAVVTTGNVARSIADEFDIPSQAVQIWDIAKWPFVVLIVVLIIGMLYWATPNVRKTKRDIFTWGALLGFVVWVIASGALVAYLTFTNGASYTKTYGVFADAIIFMLWLWITNVAMLFGAEFDAELIRTRQLKSGLPAEELILLPPKSDAAFAKQELKAAKELDVAHELRLDAMRTASGDPNVYGRAAYAAGHAAQVGGETSTAGRSSKTGLIGPRDASAPRPSPTPQDDGEAGPDAMNAEDQAAVEEARLQRRDDWLRRAQKERLVRDRLDRQRAAAEHKKQEREREKERARKLAEATITREERWAKVAEVRAQFDPPETPARDQVDAERRARRAAYDAERAEQQAKAGQAQPAPKHTPKHHKSDTSPQPSAFRTQIEQEQQLRRDKWYAAHPTRHSS